MYRSFLFSKILFLTTSRDILVNRATQSCNTTLPYHSRSAADDFCMSARWRDPHMRHPISVWLSQTSYRSGINSMHPCGLFWLAETCARSNSRIPQILSALPDFSLRRSGIPSFYSGDIPPFRLPLLNNWLIHKTQKFAIRISVAARNASLNLIFSPRSF